MNLEEQIQMNILERAQGLIEGAIRGELTYSDFLEKMQKTEAGFMPESTWELIFEQNMIQAVNSGTWQQQYEQTDEDFDLYFSSAKDERVDDECAEFDGFVAPKSDDRWTIIYPPLHIRCRCTVRAALPTDSRHKTDIDTSLVDKDFQTWPGAGFTIKEQRQDELETVMARLEAA